MRTLRILNSPNVDSSKKRLPTREKLVIERTAFAGAMPIKSAVGIILVFYYFSSLGMLHALVTERIPSQFESLASICLFLATLSALSGLYHQQGGKFIPLLIIQICTLLSLVGIWFMYIAEISMVRRRLSARLLATWIIRCLLCSSLTVIHFVFTYTIHRYVNILFAEKAEGRLLKQSNHDNLTVLQRDDTFYYDVNETPSKKKFVTFAV